VHRVEPAAEAYLPAEQSEQADDSDAPSEVKYLPAAQLVQAAVPEVTA
jgi:hypothetical protein